MRCWISFGIQIAYSRTSFLIFDIFATQMKNMKFYKFLSFVFLSFFLSSCSVLQTKSTDESDLEYMKNIEEVAIEASQNQTSNTLQPGDQLIIVVSAQDQDVVKVFNQNYSAQEQIRQSSLPGGNSIPNQAPSTGPTYIVDSQGFIDFPILGKIETTARTLDEFKDDLKQRLRRYIKEPFVHARLTNYKITVLGEVRSPGQYTMADGKATILNALGMAGDLTIYGKRDDILVVRNVNGVMSKERIDLTDAGFVNSPYYNMKQGDVIYVTPNKTQERLSKRDPNSTLYISIASIVVTILALIIRK